MLSPEFGFNFNFLNNNIFCEEASLSSFNPAPPGSFFRITENGNFRITENVNFRITE